MIRGIMALILSLLLVAAAPSAFAGPASDGTTEKGEGWASFVDHFFAPMLKLFGVPTSDDRDVPEPSDEQTDLLSTDEEPSDEFYVSPEPGG